MDLMNTGGDLKSQARKKKGECEQEIMEFAEAEIRPVRSQGERELPALVWAGDRCLAAGFRLFSLLIHGANSQASFATLCAPRSLLQPCLRFLSPNLGYWERPLRCEADKMLTEHPKLLLNIPPTESP